VVLLVTSRAYEIAKYINIIGASAFTALNILREASVDELQATRITEAVKQPPIIKKSPYQVTSMFRGSEGRHNLKHAGLVRSSVLGDRVVAYEGRHQAASVKRRYWSHPRRPQTINNRNIVRLASGQQP
jgi:hypothetical protein